MEFSCTENDQLRKNAAAASAESTKLKTYKGLAL